MPPSHRLGRLGPRRGLATHERHGERDPMKRRTLLVAALALLVALGIGAAYAYFTATGSGAGSASAGTLQPVTVAAFVGGDTPSSNLLPGGTADVILRVNNTNAFSVKLVSVSGNGTITASGSTGTCT